jgi:hypothetical protein
MNKVIQQVVTWLRFEGREERLKRLMRQDMIRIFGACPICSRSASAHWYFDLAFTGIGTVEDVSALELTKARAWSTLRQFREADMETDLRIWRVVECPSGGMVVGVMLSRYEYSRRDQLLDLIPLTADERDEVNRIANGHWVEL